MRTIFTLGCALALVAAVGCDSGSSDGSGSEAAAPVIGGGAPSSNSGDGTENGGAPQDPDPTKPGNSTDPGNGNAGGGDPGNDGTGTSSGAPGTPSYPLGCDFQGFTSAASGAEVYPESPGKSSFFYWESYLDPSSQSSQANALFNIFVRPFAPYNGPTTPGTYSLAGSSLGQPSTPIEVVIATGCTQGCQNFYLVDEGNIVFTHLEEGVRMAGYLDGAVAHEITLNQDGTSSPVPNGGKWCLDQHPFDAPMAPAPDLPGATEPAEPNCVTAGNGSYLGHNVKNFSLPNCYGDMVELHGGCGQSKALWLMATAGWCSACSNTLEGLASNHGGLLTREAIAAATPGLDMIVVLGENGQKQQPTQSYCQSYAESHNVDPAMVVIDWSGSQKDIPLVEPLGAYLPVNSLGTTWDAVNPYLKAEGGMVQTGFPWNAVLRGTNMEYIWSDYSGGGGLNGTINMLLNE